MKKKITIIFHLFWAIFSLMTISCSKETSPPAQTSTTQAFNYSPFYYFCNFSKNGNFLYVGSFGDATDPHIGVYNVDSSSGETTLIENISSEYFLKEFVHHPTLDIVYVTMDNTSIYSYEIDSTNGDLLFQHHTPMNMEPTDGHIWNFKIRPQGDFAYALGSEQNIIEKFSVAADGILTYEDTTSGGTNPLYMVFNATGDYLYVANFGGDNISVYNVDSSSGGLALAQTISTDASSSPNFLAIDPSNTILAATNYQSNSLYLFSINPVNGQLTFDESIDTGIGPSSINFSSITNGLYVGNYLFNSISLYHYTTSPIAVSFIKNINSVINYPNSINMHPNKELLCASSSGLSRIFQVLKVKDSTGDLTPITEL